jgi:hypothetical protein
VSFSKLKEIASEKGILIIEDCALSWGAEQSGVLLGSKADAVIFSMELSKTISTGWGGVLLSRNEKLSIRLNEHYEMLGKPGFKRVIKETFQTAISGICQKPEIHWIGKYIIYLFFKLKIFKYSTPDNEVKGSPSSDFILKLAGPQLMLLAFQWKKMSAIQFQYSNNISFINLSIGTFLKNTNIYNIYLIFLSMTNFRSYAVIINNRSRCTLFFIIFYIIYLVVLFMKTSSNNIANETSYISNGHSFFIFLSFPVFKHYVSNILYRSNINY